MHGETGKHKRKVTVGTGSVAWAIRKRQQESTRGVSVWRLCVAFAWLCVDHVSLPLLHVPSLLDEQG